MTSIDVVGVAKSFGGVDVLRDVSVHAPDGQLTALLGPSGSGKTTLLRIIAGLERPDGGRVLFHGEDATDRHARDRAVGFVFQHYALFRHMTVFENVAFGLRVRPWRRRLPRAEIRARVDELLALVQLDRFAARYPAELSGGQRQRVALARALAVRPRVLLLDEPFGALDAQVRRELRRWLRRLHEEMRVTSVIVTHDQEEALEVADRVVVMHEGRVEQAGTPDAVYASPASPFVYGFLGHVNLFHARVAAGRAHIGGGEVDAPEWRGAHDQAALAFVRTHDIEIARAPSERSVTEAVVRLVRTLGKVVRLELDGAGAADGQVIDVELPRERFDALGLLRGERVFLTPTRVGLFEVPATDTGCTAAAETARAPASVSS
jgi:sulfate transport system ATP-binding protein